MQTGPGLALGGMLLASTAATAAEQTVKLAVENMYCAACPYIVRETLAQLPGVHAVAVSYEDKTAVVTFDDQEVSVAALTEATAGMGYPSSPKE